MFAGEEFHYGGEPPKKKSFFMNDFMKAAALSALVIGLFAVQRYELQNTIEAQSRKTASYIDEQGAYIYRTLDECHANAPNAFKGTCEQMFAKAEHLGKITDATRMAGAPMDAVQVSIDFKKAAPLYISHFLSPESYIRHDGRILPTGKKTMTTAAILK